MDGVNRYDLKTGEKEKGKTKRTSISAFPDKPANASNDTVDEMQNQAEVNITLYDLTTSLLLEIFQLQKRADVIP